MITAVSILFFCIFLFKLIKAKRKAIGKLIFDIRFKFAVKRANWLRKHTKYKYLVLRVAGQPRVYKKQNLKEMIRRNVFQKGTTIQALEAKALYATI